MSLRCRTARQENPIVTREAFEAFSCHHFKDGTSWRRADVSIPCNTPEHAQASQLALFVICCYPAGVPILFALLLHCARRAILSGRPTSLSTAIAFLHREYRPRRYWWELVEMLRRLLLVGVLVVIRQGSVEQLALGSLLSLSRRTERERLTGLGSHLRGAGEHAGTHGCGFAAYARGGTRGDQVGGA